MASSDTASPHSSSCHAFLFASIDPTWTELAITGPFIQHGRANPAMTLLLALPAVSPPRPVGFHSQGDLSAEDRPAFEIPTTSRGQKQASRWGTDIQVTATMALHPLSHCSFRTRTIGLGRTVRGLSKAGPGAPGYGAGSAAGRPETASAPGAPPAGPGGDEDRAARPKRR